MSGPVEHAEGPRPLTTFPAEWGIPPGHAGSEERAAWVRRHVKVHRALRAVRPVRSAVAAAALAKAKALGG